MGIVEKFVVCEILLFADRFDSRIDVVLSAIDVDTFGFYPIDKDDIVSQNFRKEIVVLD